MRHDIVRIGMNYFSHLISADTTSLLSALYSPMVHPSSSNSDSGDSSSNKDGSSKMERPKKKVEWSSNLNPTEPPAPEDRSPMWDSEAGKTFNEKPNVYGSLRSISSLCNPCN